MSKNHKDLEVLHPHRHNNFECGKGQIFGGECNVTRCTNTDATKWNVLTYALYCKTCSNDINKFAKIDLGFESVIAVDKKPTSIEEMDKLVNEKFNFKG